MQSAVPPRLTGAEIRIALGGGKEEGWTILINLGKGQECVLA